MIISFADKNAKKLHAGERPKKIPPDLHRRIQMKLVAIDSAVTLEDLRIPPSNHLEQLSGDREGQHSIRINDQWRICFVWQEGNVSDVAIVDYH